MKYSIVVIYLVLPSLILAQTDPASESSKKLYLAAGVLAGISSPYATSGNENGIALSGLNSGLFIGAGMLHQLSKKVQLNQFVTINNISPHFHYKLPVEDMSYTSLFGQPRTKYPAPYNAAALTYQFTTGLILPFKQSTFVLGAGAGINYVFTKRATAEQSTLLIRSEVGTGNFKECTYTQRIHRISFDLPIEFALEKLAGIERLRIALRYHWAITPRSTGTFSFDKNQGVASGQYRFIGSTVGVGVSYGLTN